MPLYSPLGWCVRRPKIKFGHATRYLSPQCGQTGAHTHTTPFIPVARFGCVTKRSVSASFISSVPVCRICVWSARWLLYLRQRLVPQRVSEAPKKSAFIHCTIKKGCCWCYCCTQPLRYMDNDWDTHKHRIIIVATASHIIFTLANGINVYLYFLRFESHCDETKWGNMKRGYKTNIQNAKALFHSLLFLSLSFSLRHSRATSLSVLRDHHP